MEKELEAQNKLGCVVPPLSESETRVILQVIHRDEQLRMRDQCRVMKLKTDLQALRRKGALKSLLDADGSQERTCARCRRELGRIINRGAPCKACRLRVCKSCREFGNRTTEWVCCVCRKNMELQAATGEWMNEYVKWPNKRLDEKSYVPPADIIKRTIRRSWTISNTASSKGKDSKEMRSMKPAGAFPRHPDSDESVLVGEKENSSNCPSREEDSRKRRENMMKAKAKSFNACEESDEGGENEAIAGEVIRANSDGKNRYKSQKMKIKIKRQASLEEQFPFGTGLGPESGTGPGPGREPEEVSKAQEKKFGFLEELKIPKIEIIRKNSAGEGFKGMKEYGITSPNSSKLRERFSRSKLLKQDSKNLNVELSKSSDSGIGVSRSTEDESIKGSESVIFKFFDIGPETRLNKSDSERSPNFLDTVSLFTRSRSHERSVSSDSSDKNLSDLDKPSIKIRKRHEYSESRDSSSSYEGSIFDTHISNRVRKLHEVALKQMSEENAKSQKSDPPKRTVDFKYPVEFGSYDNIPSKTGQVWKVRKFKSLERTDSNCPSKKGESFESEEKHSSAEGLSKVKSRLKKQERFDKRLSLKDKRNSLSRDSGLSGERRKEKRCRGFLKSRKDVGEEESDENADGKTESKEESTEILKRLSRKDKKSQKKPKRALSEEHRGSRERSMLFSITTGKKRSDSETRQERSETPEESVGKMEVIANKKTLTPKTTKPDLADIRSYLEVVGKILPMSDDYKIVFISSDSSAKENRSISSESEGESTESGTDSSKKAVSDCDWDYFEPSSLVRPFGKDWNWGSPRVSPVFSTSDDNSPKFPRRGLRKFSVRDSPISFETDTTGFSPNLRRKIMEIDSSKFRKKLNIDTNEDSLAEEKEIVVCDFKMPPSVRVLALETEHSNAVELKHSDDTKKQKKRRKNRKSKKGAAKEDDITEGEKTISEEVPDATDRDPVAEEKVEQVVHAVGAPPLNEPVAEVAVKIRPKGKKQKNKKKSEKRSKSDAGAEGGSNSTPEYAGDELMFQTGNFGFQNIIPSQSSLPEVFPILQNTFQNFVPIPVPVPILVPFPVPATIWTQNYQNFFFPNFSFNSENFELFNNLQNVYLNQNLGSPPRNDNKDSSFKPEENSSNGTGNGSIHIRPINMQRPALALGPLPSWSQGLVNSAVSDPTCLANEQSVDKAFATITKDSVARRNDKEDDVSIDGENATKNPRNKKCKRTKKKSKCLTESSENGIREESVEDMVVSKESDEVNSEKSDDFGLTDIFVEGKTFREVKHILKHKNKFEDSETKILLAGDETPDNVIVIDETVSCDLIESSLLNIDKKSECSSTSHSEDSDGEKSFKKSYYFNSERNERKTSDDSDIADLSSPEEETKSDSSQDLTASEDEGNPDSKFSEVYVVNRLESEVDLKCEKLEEIPVPCFSIPDDSVVLKKIKKFTEDDVSLMHEMVPSSESEGEPNEIRFSSEDSVTLVGNLTVPESTSASIALSEIEPTSLTVTELKNNTSDTVFSGLNLVDAKETSEKYTDSIEASLSDPESTRKRLENDERDKNSLGGDVTESEVNNSELIEESSQSNVVESVSNQHGLSFLDKIESRIRHFSHLESISLPPHANETKYTSLVMITQDRNEKPKTDPSLNSVKVITNNTTKVLNSEALEHFNDDICLKHTNRKNEDDEYYKNKLKSLEEYYTMTLENSRGLIVSPKKPNVIKNMTTLQEEDEGEGDAKEEVQVVTDDKTLSAVICLEEGLADDDSWVEDLEKDRENDFVVTITEEESSSGDETHIGACIPIHNDREEELRGYHRGAINFTLHTIVEESCEESEVEDKTKSVVTKKQRPTSATDLEKYFYFDIGGGVNPNFENQDLDTFSESSSSIYSDGGVIDDGSGETRESSDQNQLSTSRLEKYFLNFDRDGREKESDGSVGSDSEGPPSPEQRRKRLFRARASNRLHSNSLDNLVQIENEQQSMDMILDSEDSSTETDVPDPQNVDKSDDSVKRKKKRKISGGSLNVPLVIQEGNEKNNEGVKECRESLTREHRHRESKEEGKENELDDKNYDNESEDERSKTPQPDFEPGMNRDKQQSRDSGFVGSCDDLLKDQKTAGDSSGSDTKKKVTESSLEKLSAEVIETENFSSALNRQSSGLTGPTPPTTGLTRKDSFNNWSSDEETNLMMSKMRQFFKAMVSVPKNSNKVPESSNPSSPQVKIKGAKPPQLVYFENELTRLMKTVPGIRDDQVREIVEYLSSEDTWSDSYDSSDYTSSDLEGTAAYYQRSQLQQEISESCKQIIDNFDQSKGNQESKPKVPPRRNSSPLNRETVFVYQKLVASFNKITSENENASSTPRSSPPLFAKIMHHIGSRLVALMHEVSSNSSGEGSISSHKARYHKRLSQKLSNVSSTTEEECGLTDESDYKAEDPAQNMPYFQLLHHLPRSKSHDLLLEEAKMKSLRSSSSGVSDIAEEKEASDYERFSWRGSFESALMADSRSKLTLLSNDSHSSNTALAAKRRSAGDLLFLKSLSREQLDRVRSCGSIGGVAMEDKNIWTTGRDRSGRRRSSVPDATSPGSGASADGDEDSSDSEIMQERSITLPRSLQSIASCQNTNSLPRLPTTGVTNTQNLSKAQSVQHFLPNAKSARYRPPGFSRIVASSPKRTVSAPGLQLPQPSHARRERRRNQTFQANNPSLSVDELNILEATTTPHAHGGSKSASPSPIVGSARSRLRRGTSSVGSPDWSTTDEIQRLVALDQQRQSNSSLGARSDSMASVYSGAGEGRSCSIPVKGEVEFGLQYNYKAGDLEIYVKQCKDLAAVDAKRNRSDPYVKVYLLPDKSKSGKRKTKVKKHTLNPLFDEVLKFHISLSGLETRTLWLTVWHSDMFGRNDFLGEVMMSLENKVFDDPTPQSYLLQERTEPFEDILSYKGEIIIGLKFIPPDASTLQKKGKRSKGTLNVRVKEAKNLTAVKSNGVSDPFCKSYLLPDKGKNSKQKTPVQRRTCNPFWNHTFVYEDVSLQELSERCLELTVWDHDRLASNEFLGGLRFSLGSGKHYGKAVDWMDSTGKEISLWQSMLEKPNLWVEGCLPLRASLDPPNTVS